MTHIDSQQFVTLQELLLSSLAQTEALSKRQIETARCSLSLSLGFLFAGPCLHQEILWHTDYLPYRGVPIRSLLGLSIRSQPFSAHEHLGRGLAGHAFKAA
jgi:hypothetical protein